MAATPITITINATCDRPGVAGLPLTCLQRLAEAWIGTRDLCAGCTTRLMAALDAASPEPLTWHAEYTRRAAGSAR